MAWRIGMMLALALALLAGPAQAAGSDDGVAVIIGNKSYKAGVPAVDFAHNDAEAVKRWVVEVLGYRADNVMDLRDAGKAQLEATFGNHTNHEGKLSNWIRSGRSDVVVFYSGHGIPGAKDGRSYLLPSDADPDTAELNGYPLDVLVGNLGKLPARSVTVFLDACFSGLTPAGPLASNTSAFGIRAKPVTAAGNVTVLSAASGTQAASWDTEARHGLFTEYLLRAVYGEADKADWGNGDGKVTLAEVKAYLDDEMTYRASRTLSRKQTADLAGDTGRVVVAWTPGRAPVRPGSGQQAEKVVGTYFPPGKVFRDCTGIWCPEMVVVPAGSFMMGSPPTEAGRYDNEGPQHRVTIAKPFAVGKYEVTFAEWDACVDDGGCTGAKDEGWGHGRQPVINVSWEDAQAYVAWLKRKTGLPYRLLTEAEWEYAARAKTTEPYWWGASASHDYANYGKDECCGGLAVGRDQWVNTSPVGSFPANGFGLHDLHGNVWEWVEDCWHDNYSGASENGAAWTTGECKSRVLRGGSWLYDPRYLRSARRDFYGPDYRNVTFGFRLARTF